MDYKSVPEPPDLPDSWAVRFIQPGDDEGILRVMTEAFPRWPKFDCAVTPLEHLRWKLNSHPLAAGIHVVVDSPHGIVGARLDWGFEAKVGDHIRTLRESIDRAVRPQFRKNYAMSAMRAYRQKDHDETFDMYVGYSSDAPGLAALQKYRIPNVIRYSRLVDTLVCNLETATLPAAPSGEFEVVQVKEFDDRVDHLWADAQAQFLFAIVRSSAYLNWRYADKRSGNYHTFAAVEGSRWLGYVVLRAAQGVGYVADLIALPGRDDVLTALLQFALSYFRAGGQRRAECWSEVHSVHRWALDAAGFRELRRSVGFSFRPLRFPAEEAAFLGDPAASVLIAAGDTDLV